MSVFAPPVLRKSKWLVRNLARKFNFLSYCDAYNIFSFWLNLKMEGKVVKVEKKDFILERKESIGTFYNFQNNKSSVNPPESLSSFWTRDPQVENQQILGRGKFGCVLRASVKGNPKKYRAVKVITKAKIKNVEKFRREVDILKSIVIFENFKLTKMFRGVKISMRVFFIG